MSELTKHDYLTAANVIDHLNRKLSYVEYEWWSPEDLNAIQERVSDAKGYEQIDLTKRVIRDMQRRLDRRLDDRSGYAAQAIRTEADRLFGGGSDVG